MVTDCDRLENNLQIYVLFEQDILLDYEYVCMVQEKSVLNGTRCKFTSNNAVTGGAIFVLVRKANQWSGKFSKEMKAY